MSTADPEVLQKQNALLLKALLKAQAEVAALRAQLARVQTAPESS